MILILNHVCMIGPFTDLHLSGLSIEQIINVHILTLGVKLTPWV